NLGGSAAEHFHLIEYRIGPDVRWDGRQHLFFAIYQIAGIEGSQLKSVAVRDGVGRAGFHAISAKDAAVVINVVNLGIALGAAHALFLGVVGGLYVNAVGRARRRAQEAGHALFEAILIALQNVYTTEALLKFRAPQWAFTIGIVFHHRRLKHLHEGDAHPLGNRGNVL